MLARWIVFALYLGAVGLLGWWAIVRLRNAWRAVRQPSEVRTRNRIYILALLCVFFSGVVARVITALATLVTGLFVTVPVRLAASDDLTARLATSRGMADSVSMVMQFVADQVQAAVAAAGLAALPLRFIVLFVALFTLVAIPILHPRAVQADPKSNVWFQWLANVWQAIGQRRRQNFYLTVVLVGAGYLSAAALMAIPELDGTPSIPESISVEKLRERLTAIQIGSDELEQSFPEYPQMPDDPLGELEKFLATETETEPQSVREPASQPPASATSLPATTRESPFESPFGTPGESAPDAASPGASGAQPRAWATRSRSLEAKNALNRSQAERAALGVKWRGLRAAAQVQQRYAFELTVLTYENENLNRIGARQTAEHFRSLIKWYLSHVLQIRDSLGACHGEVQHFDVGLLAWSRSSVATLRRESQSGPEVPDASAGPDGDAGPDRLARNDAPDRPGGNAGPDGNAGDRLGGNAGPDGRGGQGGHGPPSPPAAKLDKDFCTLPPLRQGDLPKRGNADDYLDGVFHAISGWLVLSESLPMTLLIGMLGFALLGASVSPIVRSHKARMQGKSPEEPLVRDLASLVIRGVSAAVVVFLGVKGGLSLLGASDTSMNPYALLLTCFAAAVHSERAWERVRDWFGGEKEEDPAARRGGGGQPPPAGSASTQGEPGGNTLPPG